MSEQIDIAVDLGAVPPPLPAIVTRRELAKAAPKPPPQVIDGVLHQGCKLVLSGTSKSNKTWCLLNLAASVASGAEWLGRRCAQMPVLYLNFELHEWAVSQRLDAICSVRRDVLADGHQGVDERLHLWNLRGHNSDITLLRPKLEEQLDRYEFGLIILDPVYKVLGDRDENANGEIAGLMNELEQLAQRTRAAIVIAHHFAKGDSTVKNAIDRMSGAGAWARDPDSLVVMTPHEEDSCFTVSMTLRNLPRVEDFVVEWVYPIMRVASELNPEALRRPQAKNKVCSDREFVEQFIREKPASRSAIVSAAREAGMSTATADRYLRKLSEAGLIRSGSGLYWLPGA
jgi:DNA-binding MarR family transcriptional regulator